MAGVLRLSQLSSAGDLYLSEYFPVSARTGDGVPELLDVYRGECEDLGKPPGQIVLHAGFSWAPDDDTALEAVRVWKGAQPDDVYREDIHVPANVYEHGEETTSDEDMKAGFIVATDPAEHAERIREIEGLGATVVVLQNNSGADPHRAIRVYGEQVLPALRGARVG